MPNIYIEGINEANCFFAELFLNSKLIKGMCVWIREMYKVFLDNYKVFQKKIREKKPQYGPNEDGNRTMKYRIRHYNIWWFQLFQYQFIIIIVETVETRTKSLTHIIKYCIWLLICDMQCEVEYDKLKFKT